MEAAGPLEPIEPINLVDPVELVHGRFTALREPRPPGLRMSDGDTFCSYDGMSTVEPREMNCPACWEFVHQAIRKMGNDRSRMMSSIDAASRQPTRRSSW